MRQIRTEVAMQLQRDESYVEVGYRSDNVWQVPGERLTQSQLEAECQDPAEHGRDLHREEWPLLDLTISATNDARAQVFAVILRRLDAPALRRRYRILDTVAGHQQMWDQAEFGCEAEAWRVLITCLTPTAALRYGFDYVTVVVEAPRPFGRRARITPGAATQSISNTMPFMSRSEGNMSPAEDKSSKKAAESLGSSSVKPSNSDEKQDSLRPLKAVPRKIMGFPRVYGERECVFL